MSADPRKAEFEQAPAAIVINCIMRYYAGSPDPINATQLDIPEIANRISKSFSCSASDAGDIIVAAMSILAEELACDRENDSIDDITAVLNSRIKQALSKSTPDPFLMKYKATSLYNANGVADIIAHLKSASVPVEPEEEPEPAKAAPEDEDDIQEPIDLKRIDLSTLNGMSIMVRKATNGQISSGRELIDRLAAAEQKNQVLSQAVQFYKANGGSANENASTNKIAVPPAYFFESKLMRLDKIFPLNCLSGNAGATRINFNQVEAHVFKSEEKHPNVPAIDPSYLFDIETLLTSIYAIEHNANFILVGPPGSGKTRFTEQLAARLGRPYYRIPVDGEMRRRDFLGGFKQIAGPTGSATVWHDGLLIQALRLPSIAVLDEFDRGDPDLIYSAHQALEHKGIIITEDEGRKIEPHPQCAIAATANTKGRADSLGLYSMTSELSEASRDRFPFWIDHDYLSASDETKLIKARLARLNPADIETITKIAEAVRTAFKEGTIRTTCSTRQVIEMAEYANYLSGSGIMSADAALNLSVKKILVGRAPDEHDLAALTQTVALYGITI